MKYNLINQQATHNCLLQFQLTEEEISEALKIHRMATGNRGKISVTMYDSKTKRFFSLTQQSVGETDLYIKEIKL